ncbi:MAG: regulatory protein RecX [Lachnospiraceae bacterium]
MDEEIRKNAIKRAMRLLEKQDRTEAQLREKLKKDQYEEEYIEEAIRYVKSYHYIDDERFARNYVRYRQESKSRQQLKITLMQKGIEQWIIQIAINEEYCADERIQIRHWIQKKKFVLEEATRQDISRMYGFLFRKGFQMEDIRRELLDISAKKV